MGPTPTANAIEQRNAAEREAPRDCRNEPPYPGCQTVVFAIDAPHLTVHTPSERCAVHPPHETKLCGEWLDDFALSGRYRECC